MAGGYVLGATTTNITTNTNVVASALENVGRSDDYFNDWYYWMSTTANASVSRIVEDYTASTGTLVLTGANLSAESGSVAFELHQKFRPDDIHNAMSAAVYSQYDKIWKQVEDTTLFTYPRQMEYDLPSAVKDIFTVYVENRMDPKIEENILYDNNTSCAVDFGTWSSATTPTGSDAATNITLSQYGTTDQQEEFASFGDYLCKCISSGSAGSHYWTALTTPANWGGIKLTYVEPIYCTTANEVKTTIVDNAGNTASSYHGGTGWELVSVTHTVTGAPTSLKAGITTAGNSITFYRGQAILAPTETYLQGLWSPVGDWYVFNDKIYFKKQPLAHRFLKVEGKTTLTVPTGGSASTMEIGEPQTRILYAAMLTDLWSQREAHASGAQKDDAARNRNFWQGELERFRKAYGMRQPALKLSMVM